jgi:hypothetical protein
MGSFWAIVLTVLSWPITGFIGYRFGIRSKKKELLLPIINDIRDTSRYYIERIFEKIDYQTSLKKNPPPKGQPYLYKAFPCIRPDGLIEDIESIINKNGHILNYHIFLMPNI